MRPGNREGRLAFAALAGVRIADVGFDQLSKGRSSGIRKSTETARSGLVVLTLFGRGVLRTDRPADRDKRRGRRRAPRRDRGTRPRGQEAPAVVTMIDVRS